MLEVDAVYTWVNHRDNTWQKLYREAIARGRLPQNLHHSVNDSARFQNRDEIRYSINALHLHAPWIRRIFIVTNCALPAWAENDPKITRIDHTEVFTSPEQLPTFNAFAIEACLHRIPGVSEHFIYFNDDVFLMKPAFISDFFPSAGRVCVFPSRHRIPERWHCGLRPVEYSMLNARRLLLERFGYSPARKLHHAPFPLLRSVMERLSKDYHDELETTRSHPFRDPTDIPLSTTLHAYFCVASGIGTLADVSCRYIDIGDPRFLILIHPFSPLRRGKYKFLCLNEVSSVRWFSGLRDKVVIRLMKKLFPSPA